MSKTFQQPFVGQRLRELREHAGLTRAKLSKLVGVTKSAIVRLETGRDVRLSNYLPIVEYFVTRDLRAWTGAEQFLLRPAAGPNRAKLGGDLDPESGAEG